MCGICGIYNFGNKEVSKSILYRMNETMTLRGPDDSGYFIEKNVGMAMRRLSIIDINTGQQPISNENDTIKVVLNGEIYNYLEIRSDLAEKGVQFNGHSDSEVILHLYLEVGADFVEILNGIFSIAIFDKKTDELLIYRDGLGVKPLYYMANESGFIFSSEIKALKPFFQYMGACII